jgi:ATP-dependent DNA helicase DinG
VSLEDILGPGGLLEQYLPGFTYRPQQLTGAQAVARAAAVRRHVAIEAPTACGKSYMYAIPMIEHVIARRETVEGDEPLPQVIIATGNISLQEQLVFKDLPALQHVLPTSFQFANLKGRGNYLCLQSKETLELDDVGDELSDLVETALEWAKTTHTGDKSEIRFSVRPIWHRLSVAEDECVPKRCEFYDRCFYEKQKAIAKEADIIVTNHSMLALALHLVPKLFRDLSLIVIDEAHAFPRNARKALGIKLTHGSVVRALSLWRDLVDKPEREEILSISQDVFGAFGMKAKTYGNEGVLVVQDPTMLAQSFEPLRHVLATLVAKNSKPGDEDSNEDDGTPSEYWKTQKTSAYWKGKKKLDGILTRIETTTKAEGYAFWLDSDAALGSYNAEMIDIGQALGQAFKAVNGTVVATSATLGLSAGPIFVEKELGLQSPEICVLESPFSPDQMRLFIPQMPHPTKQEYAIERKKQAIAMLREVILQAQGRTMVLFASIATMNMMHKAISGTVPYRVLKQYDKEVPQLLAEFKEDTSSVLFGVKSFWEGVDIPGETLSCLVIERIPFIPPTDPVLMARERTLGNRTFKEVQIPTALIDVLQGAGRLIRSMTDRGVLVFLDSRIRQWPEFLMPFRRVKELRTVEGIGYFLAGQEEPEYIPPPPPPVPVRRW